MKSIIAAIAALAVAVVSAQTTPVSITSPLTGSSFKAGGQATITWISPTTATLSQVQLVQGPASALQPVAQVASNVNTADGKLTWTVPANTPAGSNYAFELGASPNIAYSGFFSITAGDGTTASSNSSASGSSASGSSAAASSAPAASGAASSDSAAGSSAPASSGAASSGSASGSSASSSASPAASSSSSTSGAASVKAGLVGAGLAAGAAALLF